MPVGTALARRGSAAGRDADHRLTRWLARHRSGDRRPITESRRAPSAGAARRTKGPRPVAVGLTHARGVHRPLPGDRARTAGGRGVAPHLRWRPTPRRGTQADDGLANRSPAIRRSTDNRSRRPPPYSPSTASTPTPRAPRWRHRAISAGVRRAGRRCRHRGDQRPVARRPLALVLDDETTRPTVTRPSARDPHRPSRLLTHTRRFRGNPSDLDGAAGLPGVELWSPSTDRRTLEPSPLRRRARSTAGWGRAGGGDGHRRSSSDRDPRRTPTDTILDQRPIAWTTRTASAERLVR
jgi:hypothetical protein